jgi:transposase
MVNRDKGRTGYTGGMKHRKFRLSEDEIRAIERRERDTREALELRRLQGVRLYGSGTDMRVVEQVSGAARRTVADWVKAYQEIGIEGLKPGWKGGNHRKLSTEQRVECRQRIQQMTPAQALSGQTDVATDSFWRVETLAAAVENWYGVRYLSSESYRLLLIEAGLSFQQPEGIYRSRPSDAVIADFEANAEKKSPTLSKTTQMGG